MGQLHYRHRSSGRRWPHGGTIVLSVDVDEVIVQPRLTFESVPSTLLSVISNGCEKSFFFEPRNIFLGTLSIAEVEMIQRTCVSISGPHTDSGRIESGNLEP
jgi:hypothetical protein